MQPEGGHTESVWAGTADVPHYEPLDQDLETDVCVVGAGIAGLTTAYLLAREGKRVVVLDDGPIGGGETSRTTAHLSNEIDDGYVDIEKSFGPANARLVFDSHTAAINRIEEIVRREAIECDFSRLEGYLFVPPGEPVEQLDEELLAAQRAGFAEASRLDRAPLPDYNTGPCLCFPQQAQFHVLKYLSGMARAFEAYGGHIFCGTRVKTVDGGSPDVADKVYVRTDGEPAVTCTAAVVATNTPFNDLTTIHTKQHPYRTYVIGATVPRGSVPAGLYWDAADPYHYVRLQPLDDAYDVLIVGGEDHKTGQADDGADRHGLLEAWARERFPTMGEVRFRWSGQVLEPVDGLAYIGRNAGDSPEVYIATGDSGMGMTHGTIAGILLTDLIMGRDNPWASIYDPARKTGSAAMEWVKENVNVAAQYRDLVTGGEAKSLDDIAAGSGAVMRRGLHKVAVYRADDGAVHECSAVCPHLKCIVTWNSLEKSWDCPCHGSRFDPLGRVLNGPAASDLAPL